MSVLIKGMEKPKNCSDCRFYFSAFMTNPRTMKCDKYCLFYEEENCPLVEVPTPHGRLIDADDLREMQNWSEYIIVENAPTVIESEG